MGPTPLYSQADRMYRNHKELGSNPLPSSSPLRWKGKHRGLAGLSRRRDHAELLHETQDIRQMADGDPGYRDLLTSRRQRHGNDNISGVGTTKGPARPRGRYVHEFAFLRDVLKSPHQRGFIQPRRDGGGMEIAHPSLFIHNDATAPLPEGQDLLQAIAMVHLAVNISEYRKGNLHCSGELLRFCSTPAGDDQHRRVL